MEAPPVEGGVTVDEIEEPRAQVVVPVAKVTTQVAVVATDTGTQTGMLMELEAPDGQGAGVGWLVTAAGVPVLKAAIADWERGHREYLMGTGEAVEVQMVRGG